VQSIFAKLFLNVTIAMTHLCSV